MTMRTAMPIASRRAFVGLGAAAAFQHWRGALRRRDWRPFPRLDKVVRCQSSGRIVQQAKMPQMLLSLRRCGAGSSQNFFSEEIRTSFKTIWYGVLKSAAQQDIGEL